MIWTEARKDKLKLEWKKKLKSEDTKAFDLRLGNTFTCTARSIQTQRSRLGLIDKATALSGSLEDDVVNSLEEERQRLQNASYRKSLKKAV